MIIILKEKWVKAKLADFQGIYCSSPLRSHRYFLITFPFILITHFVFMKQNGFLCEKRKPQKKKKCKPKTKNYKNNQI